MAKAGKKETAAPDTAPLSPSEKKKTAVTAPSEGGMKTSPASGKKPAAGKSAPAGAAKKASLPAGSLRLRDGQKSLFRREKDHRNEERSQNTASENIRTVRDSFRPHRSGGRKVPRHRRIPHESQNPHQDSRAEIRGQVERGAHPGPAEKQAGHRCGQRLRSRVHSRQGQGEGEERADWAGPESLKGHSRL